MLAIVDENGRVEVRGGESERRAERLKGWLRRVESDPTLMKGFKVELVVEKEWLRIRVSGEETDLVLIWLTDLAVAEARNRAGMVTEFKGRADKSRTALNPLSSWE